MPRREDYTDDDDLIERLILAETVCVLYGWSAAGGPGHEPVHQAWDEWASLVGPDFTGPKAHPDLNERRIHELTMKRREIRERTLRAIEGEAG